MDSILKKIQELYSENLAKEGISSTAVGWRTIDSQNLRFEKLSGIIANTKIPITVNDYGCGYGAHLEYLIKLGLSVKEYNGYDISDSMLDAARKKLISYATKVNLYKTQTINTKADYTFVSGTFNVRFDSDDKKWEEYIKSKLNEINYYSEKGFSFNLLTKYVDWREPHLYYGDPCYWFEICKREFSKKVSLIHDYPLFEWTIWVIK